jgi:hypothetical protein
VGHGTPLEAVDLDGLVLLVGIGMSGGPISAASVKTVRMRLAPLHDVARAPDVVLLGDPAHNGVDAAGARAFVRLGAAIVVVSSLDDAPHRAIRVDRSGKFEAVRVER